MGFNKKTEKVNIYKDGNLISSQPDLNFIEGSGIYLDIVEDSIHNRTNIQISNMLNTTDNLVEGSTNLYFTDERAQDAIGSILTDSSTVDFTYNDSTPSITASVIPSGININNLSNTLSISKGGTGLTSTPSNGQLLIGNGTGYTLSTLTAGSGISITNNSGEILLSNTSNLSPYFKDDGDNPIIPPVVTGDKSIAIGDGSTASGNNSFAIGSNSSTGSGDAYTLGTGNNSFAIGSNSSTGSGDAYTLAEGVNSIAIGSNSSTGSGDAYTLAEGVNSIAIGSNSSTDDNSFTFTEVNGSVAIGSGAKTLLDPNNSYVGGGSISIGADSTAIGVQSIAIGNDSIAEGSHSISFGSNARSTNLFSVAFGDNTVSTHSRSVALGSSAFTRFNNEVATGRVDVTTGSVNSTGMYHLLRFAAGTGDSTTTASLIDLTVPENCAWLFEITVTSRLHINSTTGVCGAWTFIGLIKRQVGSSTTSFVGTPVKTLIARDNASFDTAISVSGDNLVLTVTGLAPGPGTTVANWYGSLKLTEIVTS